MNKSQITIRNIGAIACVDIDLNKVNVIIGHQSSGKSTIAKIISYCSWLEKRSILKSDTGLDFLKELKQFHKFNDAYFSSESYIKYTSSNFTLEWRYDEIIQKKITLNPQAGVFQNRKLAYIPAERNFVSALRRLGSYTEGYDNLTSFLDDWFEAKIEIPKESAVPMLTLQESYYYNKENDTDNIVVNPKVEIPLQTASSGIQSLVPVSIVLSYILNGVYRKEKNLSPFEKMNIPVLVEKLLGKQSEFYKEIITIILEGLKDYPSSHDRIKKTLKEVGLEIDYCFSQVIIEEPEQNLFPETQRELIYHLIGSINNGRDHKLLLTTHSPYVLFALNNCLLGGLVRQNIPENKLCEFPSASSWIDPKHVSIWQIEKGGLVNLQDKDGILENNFFNIEMNKTNNEYLDLLNYYDEA